MKMKVIDTVASGLLTVGGLNWGLLALFGFNLVETVFRFAFLIKTVYVLVGVAALYNIWIWVRLMMK